MESSFARCAQTLWGCEPKLREQGRKVVVWTESEVFRVLPQTRIHPPGFGVRLPWLWFEEERAAGFEYAVYTAEECFDAVVAVVEVDPFRYGERDDDVVYGFVGRGILGDPVCRLERDVVREEVSVLVAWDGERTMAMFAGRGEVVVVFVIMRGLEAPEGATSFPGCADEGIVDVDSEDAACTPRVCDFASDPTLVATNV